LPGQYYHQETGLHYNYYRDYDPELGRYIQSDPIGLEGGINSYVYAGLNPLIAADPYGLFVTGYWIESPRFNLSSVDVDSWETVSPSWSPWGYVNFIRLHGRASGFINLDVRCDDGCDKWEVHDKISIEGQGFLDVGPNLYALIIGLRFGSVAGVGMNVALGGGGLLASELHYIKLAEEKAGPIISAALTLGPTAICLGSRPNY
jgi:RHS repeat-associated protein